MRAFLLLMIFYWAQLLGRKFDLERAIFLVVIITVLGILGGIVALIIPVFEKLILWLSYLLLKYILLIVEWRGGFK